MILSIYKSRCFRYLACFFILSFSGGCTTQTLIVDYGSPDIKISSIDTAYLNDGRIIVFKDKTNDNRPIKLDKDELTYKNKAGDIFTISTKEIARLYEKHPSSVKTFLLIFGSIALIIGITFIYAVSHLPVLIADSIKK